MAKEKIGPVTDHQRGYVPLTPPKEKGGKSIHGINPSPPPVKGNN
jgi:hypothetical protein